MHGLDLFFAILLLVFILLGAWRGLGRELLALVIWSVALVGALILNTEVSRWFGLVSSDLVRHMLAFGLAFVSLYGVLSLGEMILTMFFLKSPPLRVSRILGAVAGGVRGVVVSLGLLGLAGFTGLPEKAQWRASSVVKVTRPLLEAGRGYLPEALAKAARYGA